LPSFETKRLMLRPRSMVDFEACLAMDRDPHVTRFIPGPWDEPAKHERFLRDRIQNSFGDGLGYWSIFTKDRPDQFLGWILLIPCWGTGPEIEIGWRLNRLSWGKGYATEAAKPIVEHAFRSVRVPRIVADIDPGNIPSMRVAEKIGLKCVGDGDHGGIPCKSYVMTTEDFTRSSG
jgi:RimJ/RimL family protein N-acetyltransferase